MHTELYGPQALGDTLNNKPKPTEHPRSYASPNWVAVSLRPAFKGARDKGRRRGREGKAGAAQGRRYRTQSWAVGSSRVLEEPRI